MNPGLSEAAGRCVIRARRRLGPRLAFNACKLAAGILMLTVVGAGMLALRLQQGPIEIDGLGQKIASALHDRFGSNMTFELGHTTMLQRGFGPSLATDKLVVTGADHQQILSAPQAEVFVDPVALVFGRVVPKRLEVMDVTLRLVLLKNGALAIAAGDSKKPLLQIGLNADAQAPKVLQPQVPELLSADGSSGAAPPSHRAIAMRQASAAIRQFLDILTDPQSPIAAVDRLGITRGRLVIDDDLSNTEVVYSDFDLAFDKARGVTKLTLSAKGPSGRWTVAAQASGRPGAERRFDVKADNLTIDEAQLIAGTRSTALETDVPIGFSADLVMTSDNTLKQLAGSLHLGSGFLRLDDPDQEPTFLKSVDSAFHWDGTARTIAVERIAYREATGTHFTGAGVVKPPRDEDDPWLLSFATTESGLFAPDRKGQHPIGLEKASFAGRVLPNRKLFKIDHFMVRGPEGGIALEGSFDWVKGPHLVLGAQIDPTTVAFVERAWPAFMGAVVRSWIVNHFEDGMVTSGTIRVDYDQAALARMRADRPPPDQSITLDFKIAKGRLRFLDGVPPIEDVEGIGHITGRTARFIVNGGKIEANGRQVTVSDGTFLVPNTNMRPTPATLTAHLDGPVEAITDVLSRDALKPYASLPLDASTLHGQIDGSLNKSLLLGPDPRANANAPLQVQAKVTNFTADRLVGNESLEDAALDIDVDQNKLRAAGQGRIFGGPATFEIERVGEGVPTAKIALTLDEAARARLGLNVIPGVSGPVTARVNASLGDMSKMRAQVDLDLAKTSLAANYLGLAKPAGRPAKVSFVVMPHEDRMAIEQLVVDVASLQARGAIELGQDHGFESAHFSSFKVSPGDDMRLDVAKGDGALKLTIRGSTIDARPFLKAVTSTPTSDQALGRGGRGDKKESDALKGFDVDLKAGVLTGFNKEVMNGVDLKLSKREGAYRQFAVHGRFGGDPVTGSMAGDDVLKVKTQDAGALVSFLDLYKHMEGGDLLAEMRLTDSLLKGNLQIRDFVLRDEPAIAGLVARSETVSRPDDAQAARHINAGAANFRILKVNFERQGSRLALDDAIMNGDEIGLSVKGWLDFVHNRVSMTGTFVPVYALNNMFAKIPVFGLFLGGRSNEGLLAISFSISGLASHPSLSFNPLTVVAPGILRDIFGAFDQPGAMNSDALSYPDPQR